MDHGALFDETLCGLLVVTRCLQTVEDCICTLARSAIGYIYIAFTTDLLSSPKHRAWKLGDSSSAATKCPSTMLQLLSQASRLWDKRKNGNHQVPSGTISYPLMLLILAMFQDLPAVKYLKSWIHCVPPAPLSTFIAHHHLHWRPKGTSRRRRGQSTCAGPSKESSTWNVHYQMGPVWQLLGKIPTFHR